MGLQSVPSPVAIGIAAVGAVIFHDVPDTVSIRVRGGLDRQGELRCLGASMFSFHHSRRRGSDEVAGGDFSRQSGDKRMNARQVPRYDLHRSQVDRPFTVS